MNKACCVKGHSASTYKKFLKPLAVGAIILLLLTLVLAVIMHLAEKGNGTPGFESWWDSFAWVVLYYVVIQEI